jgi:hypothetical protein
MPDPYENNTVHNNKIYLLIILVLVILWMFNPKKEDFIDYKMKTINEHELIRSEVATSLTKLIGEPLLTATTERKNYLVFSVYTTPDHNKYLGFLKKFFIEL